MIIASHDSSAPPRASWEFEATATAIQLPNVVAAGAELVLYCLGVKQVTPRVDITSGSGRVRAACPGFLSQKEFPPGRDAHLRQ